MKYLFIILFFPIALTAQKHTRYIPLGIVCGGTATLLSASITKDRNIGIAAGVLASIASSYLVRSRTDAITSLFTAGAGMVTTAGLTISLNKNRKRKDCFKF